MSCVARRRYRQSARDNLIDNALMFRCMVVPALALLQPLGTDQLQLHMWRCRTACSPVLSSSLHSELFATINKSIIKLVVF